MKNLLTIVSLGACCWLAGCGQSDDQVAGIEGTGDKIDSVVASGTVTGFGSIYVNGVHFNTDHASFTLEGEAADESALSVGMVVTVEGELDNAATGKATAVHAERILAGSVDSVATLAAGRKALGILGQTVYVNEDAALDGVNFDELAPGLALRVSGFIAGNGMITATHCDLADEPITRVTLDGRITELDAANMQFAFNQQWVSAQHARFVQGAFEALAIGSRVKVHGTINSDGTLEADQVQLRTRGQESSGIRSLEGVIQAQADGFWLQDFALDISGAAIVNGTIDNVQSGTQVMAFGAVQAGVFVAERLIIKALNTTKLRGEISAIDVTGGQVTVLDTPVAITPFTQFSDGSMQMQRYFHLGDLRLGEDIEIYAVMVDEQWQATRIIRRDRDEERPNILRGAAMLVADSTVFYLDDIAVDGSELSEQAWQMLREAAGPVIIVEVAGYFTASREFTALDVRLHALPDCDPHVVFACNDEGPHTERDGDEQDEQGPPNMPFQHPPAGER